VLDFATAHPNIMVWLNLHTFGGVLIRPLGDKPDAKMNPGDLGIFEQVEAWMTEHTGYATVSGFHEFLYEPEKPIHGDLSDYAYHQRGALAYVVELWDLFRQLGIERKKPFVDHYSKFSRKDMRSLAEFDRRPEQAATTNPDVVSELVRLCLKAGADTYLSGTGGRDYLDAALFDKLRTPSFGVLRKS